MYPVEGHELYLVWEQLVVLAAVPSDITARNKYLQRLPPGRNGEWSNNSGRVDQPNAPKLGHNLASKTFSWQHL